MELIDVQPFDISNNTTTTVSKEEYLKNIDLRIDAIEIETCYKSIARVINFLNKKMKRLSEFKDNDFAKSLEASLTCNVQELEKLMKSCAKNHGKNNFLEYLK